jgi:phage terminase small subunit
MALTGKRRVFVDEYLRTRNASEAARIAGYAKPGQEGYRLLKIAEIAQELSERAEERAMSADEVLDRLAEHARGDISDFVTFVDGVRVPILDLSRAERAGKLHLVKKLKYTNDGGVEFELYDAQAALVQLGKVHRLFIDRNELSGPDGDPLRIVIDR